MCLSLLKEFMLVFGVGMMGAARFLFKAFGLIVLSLVYDTLFYANYDSVFIAISYRISSVQSVGKNVYYITIVIQVTTSANVRCTKTLVSRKITNAILAQLSWYNIHTFTKRLYIL
jgi:hypothetical protein